MEKTSIHGVMDFSESRMLVFAISVSFPERRIVHPDRQEVNGSAKNLTKFGGWLPVLIPASSPIGHPRPLICYFAYWTQHFISSSPEYPVASSTLLITRSYQLGSFQNSWPASIYSQVQSLPGIWPRQRWTKCRHQLRRRQGRRFASD